MSRTRRPLLALGLGVVVVALSACGSSGSAKTGSAATSSTAGSSSTTVSPTTTAAAGGAVVSLTTTKLGLTLVDSAGHTLYQYMPDPTGSSTCTAACSTIWPPLTAPSTTVSVGAHLTASLFSVVAGAGGTHIVAISGHPLYRFSGDKAPGDTTGQGFGGVWHAAGPLGGTM
jgi:predicted lipoprotein with Yx(FWY)xxD motif